MKKFSIDIYKQQVLLFCGKKDIEKWVRKNPVEDAEELMAQLEMSAGMAGVLFSESGDGSWFLYTEEKDLATISHEAVHLSYMILAMVGVEHDSNNHEALAYLQENIFLQAAEKLRIPTKFE